MHCLPGKPDERLQADASGGMEREARAPVRAREGLRARRRSVGGPRGGDRGADRQQATRAGRRGEELEREVEEQLVEVEVVRLEVEEQLVQVEVVGVEVEERRVALEVVRVEVEGHDVAVEEQRVQVEVQHVEVEEQRLEVEVVGLEVEEQLVALEALTGAHAAEPDRDASSSRSGSSLPPYPTRPPHALKTHVRGNVAARKRLRRSYEPGVERRGGAPRGGSRRGRVDGRRGRRELCRRGGPRARGVLTRLVRALGV